MSERSETRLPSRGRRGAGTLLAAAVCVCGMMRASAEVKVTPHEGDRRVDITVDGQPFTSYLWPTSLDKPVLYPLVAADGTTVTRGFPLQPRPGERVDHPHHAGMWFNYGNVNGFDFWNNSSAIPAEGKPKMGSVHHSRIVEAKSGKDSGELTVETVWTDGQGVDELKERTRFVFHGGRDQRIVDRTTTLTALKKVVFHDDKEGLLGIRVAHFLESPTEKGGIFNDANGRPTKVDATDTSGATGVYRTSEGVVGDKVWSTRGKWCELTGKSPEGKTENVVIFDHPGNPGYPTYWHARGYGLLAANPLGDHIFDPKAPEHNFTVEAGSSATFRYRVMIVSGQTTPADLDRESGLFARVK